MCACSLIASISSCIRMGCVTHLARMRSHMNKTFAVLFRSMLFRSRTHKQISAAIPSCMLYTAHICGHLRVAFDICVRMVEQGPCERLHASSEMKLICKTVLCLLEYAKDVMHLCTVCSRITLRGLLHLIMQRKFFSPLSNLIQLAMMF